MAKEMCRKARERAAKADLPFSISVTEILELIGDGICPVLGIRYDLTSRKITDRSANLDRFKAELGYTKENCAVISKLANSIKTNATAEQVQKVADWMKKREEQNAIR